MRKKDSIFALLVVIIWGINFTIIRIGLNGVPSMLLVALRYLATAFPAILFVKAPKIELKLFLLYGLTIGVGQFASLFYAMEMGLPAGLASILLQLQAFISPFLAYFILKEKINIKQIIGFAIAALGLFFIAKASLTGGIGEIPLAALLLAIFASFSWAISNIVSKIASQKAILKGETLNTLSLVIWSALIPPLPLLGMALLIDSPRTLFEAIVKLNIISVSSIIFIALAATLFGYGVWGKLISKYPLGKVAPLTLLVPITGLLTARIVLLEELSKLQWLGAFTILIGLGVTSIDLSQIKNKITTKKQLETIEEEDSIKT